MSMFPTKILLATDGSPESVLATRTAMEMASRTGSELSVVHVEEVPVLAHSYAGREAAEGEASRARRWLEEQVEKIEEAGGNVTESHLRLGRPAHQIVRLGEETGAGLIVIGNQGLSAFRRFLMGSVSEMVMHYASCPVYVVRGGAGEERLPSRVLLATDGSTRSEAAAGVAAEFSEKLGSELHLAHVEVVPSVFAMPEVKTEDIDYDDTLPENIEREGRRRLEAQVKQVEEAGGVVAKSYLRAGYPAREIVNLAEKLDAGAIIVGSRSFGALERALLGSVPESVVRHAHCPVLVVRESYSG
ncbi:MAG: universal stress protein [Actinomycetota bacterium]|nr:universal stress protein [Actinomycetota bacterium]HZY65130.1 universal stress protein [Rubrobacteraceae bacterium]